jgi:hypothetical protein
MTGHEGIGQQGNERKQAKERWRGTGDGEVCPLTLGFDTEMLTHVAQRGFHLPTAHEEGQDLLREERQVGGQPGLRVKFAQASRMRTYRMGTAGKPK